MWFKWGKKEYPVRNLAPRVSGDDALPTFAEAVGGKGQSAVSPVHSNEYHVNRTWRKCEHEADKDKEHGTQELLNGKSSRIEEDFRKKKEENREIVQEWEAECKRLKGENRKLEGLCVQKEQELKKHKSDIQHLTMQLWSERKTHNKKMSQIISELSSHGLPEKRDDHYLTGKLDGLVDSISQWAHLFSQGQQPLKTQDLNAFQVSDRVKQYISSSFQNFYSLMDANNVGGKARTRAVEVILLRELMGEMLWKRHIGFLSSDYESQRNLIQGISHTGM